MGVFFFFFFFFFFVGGGGGGGGGGGRQQQGSLNMGLLYKNRIAPFQGNNLLQKGAKDQEVHLTTC